MKKSGFKAKTAPVKEKGLKVAKRAKLPPLKRLRKQCDALLTPISKKMSPRCEACGKNTEVGHHWIEKSRSSYLRYAIPNIIPLCHSCHAKIHNRFGNSVVGGLDVAEIIIKKRGKKWKMQMDADQPKYVKVDRLFYMTNLARLTGIHDKLYDK